MRGEAWFLAMPFLDFRHHQRELNVVEYQEWFLVLSQQHDLPLPEPG